MLREYDLTLSWLLEKNSPGVHYLALRDLLHLGSSDPELLEARKQAHLYGPIADMLSHMNSGGWWETPGPGYNPKYRSTVWSIILLAQLGGSCEEDERITCACKYLMDQSFCSGGQFSTNGVPSGTVDCVQGNVIWALTELGYQDPRLEKAYEWMAQTVTGVGLAPREQSKTPLRYYAAKSGPNFQCGANNELPCAWGAVKVMLAFSNLPEQQRTPLIQSAIDKGIEFLLSGQPDQAGYPNGWDDHPSRNWWKFGFPVFYITDILQIAEVLTRLGQADEPRLCKTIDLIRSKQLPNGHWVSEYDYSGKTWGDFGPKNHPSKWVTLRALRVLNASQAHASLPQEKV